SGGLSRITRFEPRVYQHLQDLLAGKTTHYGAITAGDVQREEAAVEMVKDEAAGLYVKRPDSYHEAHLTADWAQANASAIAQIEDWALKQLASSIGLTQVMGFHVLGEKTESGVAMTTADLYDPAINLHMAVKLLSGFAKQYNLDLRKDFESLLRCWNSGRPDG